MSSRQLLSLQPFVVVRQFSFVGNTRFSDQELRKVVAGYIGRPLTSEQLDHARRDVTQHYVDAGFINSGAVVPDQTVSNGVVTLRVVEGRLSEVNVSWKDAAGKPTADHWLAPTYVADRIHFATSPPPMNLLSLRDELEVLRQDRNIAQINAELKPGNEAGDSRLDVQVREADPWFVALQWSDRRNPSVGSTAYDLIASHSDITGHGDFFRLQYDIASGRVEDPRLAGADDFSLDYSLPLHPSGTSFSANFTRTNALVTQLPFTPLNITSKTDSTSLTLRQPIYRRPTPDAGKPSVEAALFGTFALRDNSTSLLGRAFSFSPGQDNGSGRVTVLRFGQDFSVRSPVDALSGRSAFSLGLPWFGATRNTHGGEAGGKFFSWLAQVQYIRLVAKPDWNWQLALRAAAQLSDRPLLPVEQFSLGGLDSVRGYPENYLVRDQGVTGSVELHIPLFRGKTGASDVLTLVPFFDAGYGFNRAHGSTTARALDAVGIGIVLTPDPHFTADVFYGVALQNHPDSSHDPEDLGVHFSIVLIPF